MIYPKLDLKKPIFLKKPMASPTTRRSCELWSAPSTTQKLKWVHFLYELKSFGSSWKNTPKKFIGLWNILSTQGWFDIWGALKEKSRNKLKKTWFLRENDYLVLFQLPSLNFWVFYIALKSSNKCLKALKNNLTWVHLEFMPCYQVAITRTFI